MSMIDKALLFLHPNFHQKSFKFIIDTLLNNGYPIQFDLDTISYQPGDLKSLKNERKNRI